MNRRTGYLAALAAILLLFSTLPSAFAQDDDQDPPGRAGRVSYTSGTVSFQPGGEGDWLDAIPNRPLASGDNLWADRNSRAEVQVGSTSIRLGSETSVTLSEIDSNVTQIRLSMGTLFFRVRRADSDDAFEVDTPNLAFNVTEPGEYRIDVNENGDQTTAIVWHGSAEVTGGGSSYRLVEGQQGMFNGVDQLRYDVGEIGREDDFTRWCLDRDRRYDRVRSAQYVSPEVTGYEDLDEYGRWRYEPTYGYVWTPVGVPSGWAPYRYGHWVYISPWGWTWVEDEPWGFAPFHYGRWAYLGGGWCWVPGPVAVRPVYSPALVAFVGGRGFHIGVGVGGGVGWFPLAPGEVYVPWYRTSPRYVQNVNVTNTRVTNIQVTNVYNNVTVNKVTNVTYMNQRQGRGITVVNQQTFVNAQPVRNNVLRVDAREIQRAPVTHEVVNDIHPQRQSVFGAAKPVRYAPPQQVMARQVIATRQPVVVNRVAPVQGIARTNVAPPPVRTVQAAPRDQVKPFERGARGTTPGFGNGMNSGRPASPDNRGNGPDNRGNATVFGNRGGNPDVNNQQNRPAANVPRPGGQRNNAPQPGAMPSQHEENAPRGQNSSGNQNIQDNGRNNGPENINRPAPPVANRPNVEDNRPSYAPDNNNRGMRNVPRPGRPDQPQNRPDQQQNRPDQPQNRPDQPQNRPGQQENRPDQPQNRPGQPQNRPDQPQQPQQPQVNPQPNQSRSNIRIDNTPDRPSTPEPRPNYRTSPTEERQPAPQTRNQAPPQQRDVTPPPARTAERPPENRSGPTQARRENSPPPQRESRPQESHQDKGGSPQDRGHGKEKDNPPNK